MKRWPRVTSPASMPSTAKLTISGLSVSGPKVQRIACSGRTQRKEPGSAEAAPQRIDFGHGKSRMMAGRISASTAGVGRPRRSIAAT
jgi:hypothetical protein